MFFDNDLLVKRINIKWTISELHSAITVECWNRFHNIYTDQFLICGRFMRLVFDPMHSGVSLLIPTTTSDITGSD